MQLGRQRRTAVLCRHAPGTRSLRACGARPAPLFCARSRQQSVPTIKPYEPRTAELRRTAVLCRHSPGTRSLRACGARPAPHFACVLGSNLSPLLNRTSRGLPSYVGRQSSAVTRPVHAPSAHAAHDPPRILRASSAAIRPHDQIVRVADCRAT